MKSFKCSAAILAIAAVVGIGANAFAQVTATPNDVAITAFQSAGATTVTLTNKSGKHISGISATVTPSQPPGTGWTFSNKGCTSLGNGSSCNISVTFTNPNSAANSTPNVAKLTITDTQGDAINPVGLYGDPVTFSPIPPLASLPPSNLATSGTVKITNTAPNDANGNGYPVTLTVVDSSNTNINIPGPLSPSSEGFATDTATSCTQSVTLTGNNSCTLQVDFTNPAEANGPETLPLKYNFNDQKVAWSISDPVQGNPGVGGSVSATPNVVQLSSTPPNNAPATATVTLNNNSQPATLSGIQISNPNVGFTQSTSCPIGSPMTGPCNVNVSFTNPATAIGPEKVTLYFFFTDGSFTTATLRGNPGPTSGALLTINGTVGAAPVNLAIYDSQIHTQSVQTVATTSRQQEIVSCIFANSVPPPGPSPFGDTEFPTDAYNFQGASWSGCNAGDAFLASLTPNDGSVELTGGGYDLLVKTHYQCAPTDANGNCNAPPLCTTASATLVINGVQQLPNTQICSSDSGFLTVTNKSGSAFSGNIQLAGTSTECGSVANYVTSLAASSSAVLALAPNSSFCGGFEAQETQTIVAGQPTTFLFGQDSYQITPVNSVAGDQVTLMLVPFPDNSTTIIPAQGIDVTANTDIAIFDPGPNFPGDRCTPWQDLSGPGTAPSNNPVCGGLEIGCIGSDCETYTYSSQLDYTPAPDAVNPNASPMVGAPGFLGVHHQNFPPACNDGTGVGCYNLNTLTNYNTDCCVKTTGGKDGSAHIDVYNPNFQAESTFTAFTGFQSPIIDLPGVNTAKAGKTFPLKWVQDYNNTGQPETDMTQCLTLNADGSCGTTGVGAHWVYIAAQQVSCSTGQPIGPVTASGNSGLQNFSGTTPGLYQYNWQTKPNWAGTCQQLWFTYDNGSTIVTPAQFDFN